MDRKWSPHFRNLYQLVEFGVVELLRCKLFIESGQADTNLLKYFKMLSLI